MNLNQIGSYRLNINRNDQNTVLLVNFFENPSMTQKMCETNTGMVGRCSTPQTELSIMRSTARGNRVVNQFQGKQIDKEEQPSAGNMIIKPIRQKKKKELLPCSVVVMPVMSFGLSLKTVVVEGENDASLQVVRTSRFPKSVFQISQTSDKERKFRLVSNFSGSKYNLYQLESLMMTVDFNVGMCGKYPVRSFSIFYMAAEQDSGALFRREGEELDLSILFDHPENQGKILKLSNEMPSENEKGEFSLTFGRRNVLPAIENSVVLDADNKQQMEMVKTSAELFEINYSGLLQRELCVAFAVASLDFKWAIQ